MGCNEQEYKEELENRLKTLLDETSKEELLELFISYYTVEELRGFSNFIEHELYT